jgi:hypothetical protein
MRARAPRAGARDTLLAASCPSGRAVDQPLRAILLLVAASVTPFRPTVIACCVHLEQEPPTFVALDPASVRAALVSADPITKSDAACLAELRIECPADHAGGVEALVFRVTPKARGATPVIARRVAPPAYGRAGRAAFPGAPCTYQVLVPLDAKAARGATVEVLELSAWTGAPPAEREPSPPVEVGEPSVATGFDAERGQSIPRTTIALTNHLAHDVDVVLRADFVNPRDATTLVRGRAAAKRTTELVVAGLPLGNGEYIGAEIRRVRLVDWSILVDDGQERARELLSAAWARWDAVPNEKLPVTAHCRFDYRSPSLTCDVVGEAEFGPGGKVTVTLAGTPPRGALEAAQRALRDTAAHVSRADTTTLLSKAPTLIAWAPQPVIALAGHPLPDDLALPRAVELRGDTIRAVCMNYEDGSRGLREDWDVIDDGARWRLAGRRVEVATSPRDAAEVERVEWLRAGELWLPARVTRTLPSWAPGAGFASTLTFESWRQGTATLQAAAAPTGPLADELRAAWDGFYRHPSADVRVECAYTATSPGTDAVWLGRKKLTGTFTLERLHGAAWGTARATVEEKKATADEQERLGMAALDRLSIWSNRDLCREPRFDEAFRGATLTRDGEWIVLDGARYLGVKLVAGQIAALRSVTGEEAQLRWKSVDGASVPVELTRRKERIALTWSALPGGWRWPTKCEFHDVFVDWGPETLECSKVRVTPIE